MNEEEIEDFKYAFDRLVEDFAALSSDVRILQIQMEEVMKRVDDMLEKIESREEA